VYVGLEVEGIFYYLLVSASTDIEMYAKRSMIERLKECFLDIEASML
jgi:hypothetical protein